MPNLFKLPKAVAIDSGGRPYPGALANFYETGTTTPKDTYTDEDLTIPHENPVEADANGVFPPIYYDIGEAYRLTLTQADGALIYTVDPIDQYLLTQSEIGAILYPITAAETSAGVTPTKYQYAPGWFDRYGTNVVPGTTDMSAAINAALSCDQPCFGSGTYAANNLTQSHNFQRVTGIGKTHIVKNANGAALTSTGDDVVFTNIDVRDDAQAYTGHGFVSSGDRCIFDSCGGFLIAGRALLATGQAVQVRGTCNIWRSRDVSGTGYDIEIGVSGTATLYHRLHSIYTGIATSGIKFVDCGGHSIVGSQFGKLHDAIGTGPAGVGGVLVTASRINGDVTLDNSGAQFSAVKFSSITLTLGSGTSGHRIDESNVFQTSPPATIVDNSNESYVVDSRLIPELQAYTPTWTADGGGAAIGDGTLVGWYTLKGRECFFTIQLTFGSTTNPGTGNWTLGLPASPFLQMTCSAWMREAGVNDEGGIAILASGTPTFQVIPSEAPSNIINATTPFTWGTGDILTVTGMFYTA